MTFDYQKPLSNWFAEEGDYWHKRFILGGDSFSCENNDSFIEVKYLDDSFEDINKISKDTGKSLLSISKLIEYEINKEFFS